MYIKMSYTLSAADPTFLGNPSPLHLEPHTAINKGDVANQFKIRIFNHDGTHLDGPQHFNNASTVKLADMPLESFIFQAPYVVDLEGSVREKIMPEDLEPSAGEIERADFVLIRTGYSKFRARDREVYTKEYPVFSQEFAAYLIQRFPALRGVGVDCVSIGSLKFREDGIRSHQILNGMNTTGKYLLILEDVNIPKDAIHMKRLFIIPFFIEVVDSLPVTVFCEV